MDQDRRRAAVCRDAGDQRPPRRHPPREPGDRSVYQEARQHHGESELLDELLKTPPTIDADRLREAGGNIGAVTSQQLHEATAILDAKATPAEIDGYKTFVMRVAQTVASAHKEGGFLGIGGKEISDTENQALDQISAALGTPPAA